MKRQATVLEKIFATHVLYTKSVAELKHVTTFERILVLVANLMEHFASSFLGLELALLVQSGHYHQVALQLCRCMARRC